ncbi:oxidation resistance protein 1 [Aspergillus wentii]
MSSTSQGEPPSTTTSSSSSRSGSRTPQKNHPQSSFNQSPASYLSYPVSHVVSGLYRRFTDSNSSASSKFSRNTNNASINTSTSPHVFTPVRTVSPFQPPPLTPLSLTIDHGSLQQQLLTRALAEEIRLLVPARLQLVDTWRLAYSLDRDGASLATLYENCREFSTRSPRAGYVLIVRDASSPSAAVFGAYMTDPPHPNSHYYGTGECFLWRASVPPSPSTLGLNEGPQSEELLELAGLPPPPSADTTHATRFTTLRGDKGEKKSQEIENRLAPPLVDTQMNGSHASGTSTPERIRFKAFPYSGVNDYMMFCETGFLSLGGGDGHYGLWIDSNLEKGVSASCQTFGNEHLSDEGVKFDILGVEVWYVGA